jgi:hypothetical protein
MVSVFELLCNTRRKCLVVSGEWLICCMSCLHGTSLACETRAAGCSLCTLH